MKMRKVKSFLVTLQFNAVYLAAEEGEKTYPQLVDPFRVVDREVHLDPGNGRELPGAEGRAEQQLGYGALIRLDCDSSPVGTGAKVSQLYKHPMLEDQLPPVITTKMLWRETLKNQVMQHLMEVISRGECRLALQRFKGVFDDLTVVDRITVREQDKGA